MLYMCRHVLIYNIRIQDFIPVSSDSTDELVDGWSVVRAAGTMTAGAMTAVVGIFFAAMSALRWTKLKIPKIHLLSGKGGWG